MQRFVAWKHGAAPLPLAVARFVRNKYMYNDVIRAMSEFYFDTLEGRLLVGAAAADRCLEQQGPAVVVPLGELVTGQAFAYDKESFDRLDCRLWDKADYLAFGAWALALVQPEDDETVPLRTKHVQRLNMLGLGPSINMLERMFGRLVDFQRELGAPIRHGRSFMHWGYEDYLQYGRQFAQDLGRKPEEPDYRSAAHDDKGPPLNCIRRHFGSLGEFNEHLGYPNVRAWDKSDYLRWGARAMKANPQRPLGRPLIDTLSRQKRGPSTRSIINHFDSLGAFQFMAEQYLQQQEEMEAELRAEKLRAYRLRIAKGTLPESFETLDDDELMTAAAKHRVLEFFFPVQSEERRMHILEASGGGFLKRLARAKPGVSLSDIERTIVDLGLFDDIWPFREDAAHLHVPKPASQKIPA